MAKKLACWIGRHTWVTRVEQGESYKVCSACGKPPRSGRGDITGDISRPGVGDVRRRGGTLGGFDRLSKEASVAKKLACWIGRHT